MVHKQTRAYLKKKIESMMQDKSKMLIRSLVLCRFYLLITILVFNFIFYLSFKSCVIL
jgi:hypothetical protein